MEQTEAEKLAEEIVGLDERVFSAGIISNTGETLGGYVRQAFRSKYPVDKEGWAAVDFAQALIIGSAKRTDRLLSEMEAIVFIRKELKQILIWDQNRGVIAAAAFDRSISGTDLSKKIRSLLSL
jgi:hypothetical protein